MNLKNLECFSEIPENFFYNFYLKFHFSATKNLAGNFFSACSIKFSIYLNYDFFKKIGHQNFFLSWLASPSKSIKKAKIINLEKFSLITDFFINAVLKALFFFCLHLLSQKTNFLMYLEKLFLRFRKLCLGFRFDEESLEN